MKINYFTFTSGNSKGTSIKYLLFGLVMMLSVSFGYSQETMTITTTSDDTNWVINFTNSGGAALSWLATGPGLPPGGLTGTGNNPSFDFSGNTGNGDITIEITSTDNFDFVTVLLAPGREISDIDLANLDNLVQLEMPTNQLMDIDLEFNTALQRLDLDNNQLTSVDISNNVNLITFDASFNELNLVDVDGIPNLVFMDLSNNEITSINLSGNNQLTQINLDFNLLTTASIGQVIDQVDAYGTGGFGHILSLTGNPGDIPASSIDGVNNLLGRDWIVRPPVIYDFGDAPDSYGTTNGSGGPQHIIGDGDLYLGSVYDDELDGFPGVDADGDDNDKVADEDSVDPLDLAGISTSTDVFSVDVDYTNNTSLASNIHAWIDFDGSGSFDADEYAISPIANNSAGTVTLTWTDLVANGVDIVQGDTYARFRTTSDVLTASDPGGIVNNGEVEDYALVIELDFDEDGVPDSVDVDDDNDGILDVDEAGNTDPGTNEDRINLDADSDGCFDVVEAFTTDVIDPDPDGDGILGTSPVAVDANGQVTGQGGYTPANDLNGNSIPDFQEAGVAANITTEPTDQDLIIGDVTFTVVTDLAAGDENYQWEENIGGNTAWLPITDAAGSYAGAQTASLVVTSTDAGRVADRYRVVVSNIAYACDPETTSVDVGYITPDDFDLDGVFDIVDVDDDNDGILDVDEAGNTDPGTNEDRINLDADSDGCFDVVEAFTTDVIDPDPDGDGILGTSPVAVDANGQVTGQGGYTPANDLNASGTPDFQEAGVAANITTQPVEQEYVQSGIAIFSVVSDLAAGDEFYQWQEDSGAGFVDITDGADFAGTNTADLSVTIPANFDKVFYRYRVLVRNVAYACDLGTFSTEVGFVIPGDFDRDGVFDIDDLDDDNDGILDTVEDDGVVDRDTNGDGSPDKRSFDADGDGCFDTLESGVLDGDSNGLVGTGIITSANVDADGLVVSDANGAINAPGDAYGPLNDLDNNGTADFQEEGFAASITADPTDQDFVLGGSATFTATAIADTYQWEFSTDGGANWMDVVDDANNAGATTNTLVVSNLTINEYDNNTYRLVAEYISYVCDDVPAESLAAGFNNLADFDADTVPDVVDVDDDNDGILDVTEAGNTDPGTNEDRINLDSDGDGCFDVTEALTTDVLDPDPDGDGILGTSPVVVDANGQVTGQGGYTTPNDLDNNGTPDFQEAGAAAAITTQPVDQNFIPGGAVTFDVVASADTYQWEESTDGSTWTPITDGGDYSGATTASLTISNVNIGMLGYSYRVMVNNIAYACDPVTTSDVATLVSLPDNDNDGVPDIVDVDDDNDGIFDTVEDAGPNGGDTNNNTIPDRFELDSDSDGCDDVVEAGFTDGDGDGLLGNSPVTVDPTTGQVTSGTDGYTTPNDLDNNGTFDFQEAGDVANITDDPSDQDFVLNGSASFTATSDGDTYQWEISVNGAGFVPLSDDAKYSGTSTATLIVSNLLIPDYFDEYRVVVTNIAFACDPGDTSDAASYNILDDTDNDGVFDIVDVDDDNDGIFDTVEGEVTDTNLDGRPDRISLDSDSDGCADAIEAGFTDPDGDGILGTSPVTVDANGQVTGQGGYTTPNDLDNNGVFDFQEAGEPSSIENQPEEVEIALGDDAIFEISSVATFYQWQQSMDDGNSWSDLVNDSQYSGVTTDRLLISDARGRLEGSRYRVVLSSPDYACDPNEELVSDNVRLVFNTELIPSGFSPNGDGENDLFSVPGLIETPDFSMEVFDRWGNSVYKYNNNGSLNPDWWDGRSTGNMTLSKGQLVPAGTYFYLIKYNDGNKSPDKGWVYVNY